MNDVLKYLILSIVAAAALNTAAFSDAAAPDYLCPGKHWETLAHHGKLPLCTLRFIESASTSAAVCSDEIEFHSDNGTEEFAFTISETLMPGDPKTYHSVSDSVAELPPNALSLLGTLIDCSSRRTCKARGDENGLQFLKALETALPVDLEVEFQSPVAALLSTPSNSIFLGSESNLNKKAWFIVARLRNKRILLFIDSPSPFDHSLYFAQIRAVLVESEVLESACQEFYSKE